MSDDTTGVILPESPPASDSHTRLPEQHSPTPPAEVGGPESSATPTAPAATTGDGTVETTFGWTRSDQGILCVLAVIVLGMMGWQWARLSGWGAQPIEVERHESRRLEYRIEINTATSVEWVQFEGIGQTLADRIIADREQNGPFESIDDLQRVKGIGPKTIARIRRHLKVATPEPE
jgi:competence protein ComEA